MNHRTMLATCAAVCALLAAPSAPAQEEIVVTASRISAIGFDTATVPVVHLKRRPDYMVVTAYIESDSRDARLRGDEVNKTLRALAKKASTTANIELGLSRVFETGNDEIEYVIDFDIDAVEMSSGFRTDTSRVSLVVKSPVLADDPSPEAIYARIENFLDAIPVTGRAVVNDTGEPNFSLVDLAQYREPLLRMLADDAKRLRAIFGAGYRMSVSGFEDPVRWRVTGPMELSIYFPYLSSISEQ